MEKLSWWESLTQWTWVWVNSRSWWWTGRPGMLWSMGLQRVRHNWATELNWMVKILCFPGGMGWEVGSSEGGTGVYLRLIHVDVWQKPTQYGKVITFQLKINKLKKTLHFQCRVKELRSHIPHHVTKTFFKKLKIKKKSLWKSYNERSTNRRFIHPEFHGTARNYWWWWFSPKNVLFWTISRKALSPWNPCTGSGRKVFFPYFYTQVRPTVQWVRIPRIL